MKIKNNILIRIDPEDIVDGFLAIPDGVTKIAEHGCVGGGILMRTVIFPKTLCEISSHAFLKKASVQNIFFSDQNCSISGDAFQGCTGLKMVRIPESWLKFPQELFPDSRVEKIIRGDKTIEVEYSDNIPFTIIEKSKKYDLDIKLGQRLSFNADGICGRVCIILDHGGTSVWETMNASDTDIVNKLTDMHVRMSDSFELYDWQKNNKITEKIKHRSLRGFMRSNQRDWRTIIKILQDTSVSPITGCLPPEWLLLIKNKDISVLTQKIGKLFTQFANETYCEQWTPIDKSKFEYIQENLSLLIGQTVSIESNYSGNFGKTFKIKTQGFDNYLIIKTYHKNHSNDYLEKYGHLGEISDAFTLGGRLNYKMSYIANVSEFRKDLWCLSRMLPKKLLSSSQADDLKDIQFAKSFIYHDSSHIVENVCDGKFIDYGFVRSNKKFRNSKNIAKIVRTIVHHGSINRPMSFYAPLEKYTNPEINDALKYITTAACVMENPINRENIFNKIDFIRKNRGI